MKKLLFPLMILALAASCEQKDWRLVDASGGSAIVISKSASVPLLSAVEDLVADIKKISGQELEITHQLEEAGPHPLIIGNMEVSTDRQLLLAINDELDTLEGQWESYVAFIDRTQEDFQEPLVLAGSDELGTIFAIYHFIDEYLGVDPLYYWTGFEPVKKAEIKFSNVTIKQGEPDFKYRGWFINDEDLLTEFVNGAGIRNIDYRYYGQVVHPDVISHVMESLVRSRYNLTIPASFIDILNPPERRLVDEAARRGLYISQHHIEPVGVSAYSFFNYWEARGETHKFSFYSSRPQLEEVWETYVAEWAKVPKVVWQVGLRGIADRPMWLADPNVPQSDADRGRLISEAMQVQIDLINQYDARTNPPVTATLWAEGAALNQAGHLVFPDDVIVVFADNSPGFVWQQDFYETDREPGREYGVYYHHQLWGSGPHLAQGVPPAKTHEMFKLAYDHEAAHYAIMNVSNVREFVLGIDASAVMFENIVGFEPDQFFRIWCEERFGAAGESICDAYQQFFDSYPIHPATRMPFTLDGQMRSYGLNRLNDIRKQIEDPEAFARELRRRNQKAKSVATGMGLGDAYIQNRLSTAEYLPSVEQQLVALQNCLSLIPDIKNNLSGQALRLFEDNYEAQVLILTGITQWLQQVMRANLSLQEGDATSCEQHLRLALESLQQVQQGKSLASRGKWTQWYRGDKKMNMNQVSARTEEMIKRLQSN